MSDTVVRLVDHAAVPAGENAELARWLRSYADSIDAGRFGNLREVVLVVERDDGRLGIATQGTGRLRRSTYVGLLQRATFAAAALEGDIEDLAED